MIILTNFNKKIFKKQVKSQGSVPIVCAGASWPENALAVVWMQINRKNGLSTQIFSTIWFSGGFYSQWGKQRSALVNFAGVEAFGGRECLVGGEGELG